MSTAYYSFRHYLADTYGCRVHRISLNAGFNCPNRDGTISSEGCLFCNEAGFAASVGQPGSLHEQIAAGRQRLARRFHAGKFIAYFQNASNTHAPISALRQAYDCIKDFPDIVGLYIATRPDCIDDERLALIASYTPAYDVWIEYGVQSMHDTTLTAVNRGHSWNQFVTAVQKTVNQGINVAAHVILGLPGETREQMIATAKALSQLPVAGVKIHVLHVLKDTGLETLYAQGKITLLSEEEYVCLVCDFLEHLAPRCVIMRVVSDAHPNVLIAPGWINQKQRVLQAIDAEFARRGTSQGALCGT